VAWQVLQAVASGAYADGALERELQRARLAPLDRGLATELAYGAIRQRRLLDAWLDALGRVPADRQPPKLRWLLHLGLYQLLFCGRVPASAAVSTTVELAKRGGLARLAPVANGMLRELLRRRTNAAPDAPWQGLPQLAEGAPPLETAESLGLRHSLPAWLAELLLQWLPAERAEAFAVACNQAPALDLRINPLRSSREAVLVALQQAGALPVQEAAAATTGAEEPVAGAAEVPAAALQPEALAEPQGLTLRGRVGDLRRLPGFTAGHWCVQDRSAQRIAPLLDPQPGQRLLDACAAPGGKSTHLAELIGDQGEIWAVDRAEARLRRLQRNAERLGLQSIHPLAADAARLLEQRPDWRASFDRILVDAPCSGLGTLARHADARWRIQPDAIAGLVDLQQQLLEGLLPLLRPGGRLVYATCTVHPAENSELITRLLANHPGWSQLSSQQWWPGENAGDGFFAAVLQAPG
jgi:16S rRNA (cytosine967-C5)-methyltransferase